MSYDITNKNGGYWKTGNALWLEILKAANSAGWEPTGTVLYKHSGYHPDMTVFDISEVPGVMRLTDSEGKPATENGEINMLVSDGPGDIALSFDQATKSGEPVQDWDGSYLGNAGQIITAPDAANMAAGLRQTIEAGIWKTDNLVTHIQELITLLEAGEVRIT